MYLDFHFFNLDSFTKKEQVLHKGSKLGHVSDFIQKCIVGGRLDVNLLHFLVDTLSRHPGRRAALEGRNDDAKDVTGTGSGG
jgi:hypothetical protein